VIGNAIAVGSVAVALAALAYQVWQERKSQHLQMFTEYTRRYQEIMLQFPSDVLSSGFVLSDVEDCERERIIRYMRAYFDLCSEEYYLNVERILKRDVWDLWESGMRYGFSRPAFQQAWEVLQKDKYYFDEYASYVNQCMLQVQ